MTAASWVYYMPDDDIEYFTECSDERRQLFEDTALRLPTKELSPLIWAFFQVGDLEQLKDIAQSKLSWMNVFHKNDESLFERKTKDAILLWKQRSAETDKTLVSTKPKLISSRKRSNSEAFPQPTLSPSLRPQATTSAVLSRPRSGKSHEGPEHSTRRNKKVAKLCKERDGSLCAVSWIGGVDACHIYPWCAFGGKNPDRVRGFWETLERFWPEDKVASWRRKIFVDGRTTNPLGTETVENMLTLTETLHDFHSDGTFALRPIRMSDDKTQLELEFHWLAQQQREPTAKVDLLEEPLSSRDRTESRPGFTFCRFVDSNKPTPLVSGTGFTMTTDDPISKPLPDPGLLEMQWHLQRVLAMSGSAGWKEEDFDYDDDLFAAVNALPSVKQWLDDQPAEFDQSPCPSPSESVEIVDGSY